MKKIVLVFATILFGVVLFSSRAPLQASESASPAMSKPPKCCPKCVLACWADSL